VLNFGIPGLIAAAITLLIAFTVHEFAHAWTADQLGDDTPRFNGRLTLNPLAHLDPLGSLMLLIAGFGWAKPVPVNPYALQRRTPAGMMIVAAAGPFSNLVMAIVAAIPFKAGLLDPVNFSTSRVLPSISFLLTQFIWINLILLFFNLIPIFPLDGEKVLEHFLSPSGQDTLHRLRPYGPMILMLLVLLGSFGGLNILGILIGTPVNIVFQLLT
jgi:Zn-dependent protease